MRLGLAISLFLHSALLAWALVSFAEPREFKIPEPDPVAADVITETDLTTLRNGSRDAKLDDAREKDVAKPDEAVKDTPKPKPTPPPVAAAPPPEPEVKPPEPEKVADPPPPAKSLETAALDEKIEKDALEQVIEAEKKKADAVAKAKSEADVKAKADADAKAKAKALADAKAKALAKLKADKAKAEKIAKDKAEKAKLDSARLSALIDKAPDSKQAPASAPAPSRPTTAVGPVKGDRDGRDAANAGNINGVLAGIMRKAVSRCWNINAGLEGVDKIIVKVEVKLSRDGRISGQPRVVNQQNSPLFQDAANNAVRALIGCEPYNELPPDRYEGGWEFMILTFDPSKMF